MEPLALASRVARTAFVALGLALGLALLGAAPAAADVDDFEIERMDVDYTLGRDADGRSTLHVVETIVAVFPDADQNRGLRRAIPDTYNGQPLQPAFLSITDGAGAPRPAEVEHTDGEFRMTSRADDYVHGRQVYVFEYELRHVTWSFDDTGDEFYWDVNGDEWRQPFGEVTATVHLGAELAAELTGGLACYQGGAGATDECAISATPSADGQVISATAGPLGPRQTMTIAVGFAPGTFTPYDGSYFASPLGWAQAAGGLGMLVAIVWAALVRARRLRDSPGRPVIIAEYGPPPGVDALRAAVLLGRSSRGIPAEVLEQAVGGSIRIVETDKGVLGRPKLQAELVDASRADSNGRVLLDGLFGAGAAPGAVFEFGRTDTRMSAAARQILAATTKGFQDEGVYRRVPGGTRTWPILLGAVSVVVAFIAGISMAGSVPGGTGDLAAFLAVAAIPAQLVVVVLLARVPKSAEGAEIRDHLLGMRQFIEWAEADRIRMLQSPTGAERVPIDAGDPRQLIRLYESLLPYAVVFGQERQWGERLAVLYADSTPTWFTSPHGFAVASFAASIATLSSSASSSSSTSGGSGGGGSAGGGGGGGGGGGV